MIISFWRCKNTSLLRHKCDHIIDLASNNLLSMQLPYPCYTKRVYLWIIPDCPTTISYIMCYFLGGQVNFHCMYIWLLTNMFMFLPELFFKIIPFLCADTDLYCNTCVHHIIEWWSKMQKQIFIRDVTAFE